MLRRGLFSGRIDGRDIVIEYNFCPICGMGRLVSAVICGRYRKHCVFCDWIDYRNPVPVACAIVGKEPCEILLIKRNIEPAIGDWALPGGFIELGEDPKTAARRELEEETGLRGVPGKVVGVKQQKSESYGYVLMVGVDFKVEDFNLFPGDDACDAKFFAFNCLPEIPFKSHEEFIREYVACE